MRIPIAAVVAAACAAFHATQAQAQLPPAAALDSALHHLGGADKLTSAKRIVTRARGTEFRSAEVQGFAPDSGPSSFHNEWLGGTVGLDTVVFEHNTSRHDGTARWRRWIHTDSNAVVADFVAKFASGSVDPMSMSDRARLARRIPHLLLLELHRNRSGLQATKDTTVAGKRVTRLVARVSGDTPAIWIELSRPGWRVQRVGHDIDAAGIGPTEVIYTYGAYTPHSELGLVPSTHSMMIGGETFREMKYEKFDTSSRTLDSLTRLPVQLTELMRSTGAARLIAPGLYAISGLGGYTVMFQEFADHVVAFEAPTAHPFSDRFPVRPRTDPESLSRRYIAMIRSTIPGKPIRHVIPTHFHSDHAGGVAAFMREGAIVLSPATDVAYYTNLGRASGVSDSLIRVTAVEDQHVLADGSARIELFSSAGSPHTKDGLIAWWPSQGIVYQGDLFYYTGGQSLTAGREATHRFFGQLLRERRICLTRVYGTHSNTHGTPVELALPPVNFAACS